MEIKTVMDILDGPIHEASISIWYADVLSWTLWNMSFSTSAEGFKRDSEQQAYFLARYEEMQVLLRMVMDRVGEVRRMIGHTQELDPAMIERYEPNKPLKQATPIGAGANMKVALVDVIMALADDEVVKVARLVESVTAPCFNGT